MSHPTPNLAHFTSQDYKHFYEPAEDTFLLLDAIESEKDFILNSVRPTLCLEVGSGSGCVATFLSSLLHPHKAIVFTTDINLKACLATQLTAQKNNVAVEVIRTQFSHSLRPSYRQCIDILIFNPPYVPSESEELHTDSIYASWAGGKKGREVIDQFLPYVKSILSPNGVFYLVLIQQNNPEEVKEILHAEGFHTTILLQRKAGIEKLYILKTTWQNAFILDSC